MPIQRALRTLRWINALTGVIIIILQVFNLVSSVINIVSFDMATILLNAYSIYFGLQMFLLELQLKRLGQSLRNNYGFLFSYLGRALYIILYVLLLARDALASLLSFSPPPVSLATYWVPMSCLLVCMFVFLRVYYNSYNLLIIFIHPAFKGGNMKITDDPTLGYTSGENVW